MGQLVELYKETHKVIEGWNDKNTQGVHMLVYISCV